METSQPGILRCPERPDAHSTCPVPRRARIQGSLTFVSLNARLESNKERRRKTSSQDAPTWRESCTHTKYHTVLSAQRTLREMRQCPHRFNSKRRFLCEGSISNTGSCEKETSSKVAPTWSEPWTCEVRCGLCIGAYEGPRGGRGFL